jgi:hypothetical protein
MPSVSIPAARQKRSKLADTSSHALPTAPKAVAGKALAVVLNLFMALLSFRGISTPSLLAQGEQRRSSYFNIGWGNPDDDAEERFRYHHIRLLVKAVCNLSGVPLPLAPYRNPLTPPERHDRERSDKFRVCSEWRD